MALPTNKTKIVCTIGPACSSPEVMEQMIRAGMNVARLNFSHGDFAGHKNVIENLRAAARALGRRVAERPRASRGRRRAPDAAVRGPGDVRRRPRRGRARN